MSALGPLFPWELARLTRRQTPCALRVATGLWALVPVLLLCTSVGATPSSSTSLSEFISTCIRLMSVTLWSFTVLVTPALCAGTLTAYRSRGTLELLLAARVNCRDIVLARLVPRILFLLTPALMALPPVVLLIATGLLDRRLALAGGVCVVLTTLSLAGLSAAVSVLVPRPGLAAPVVYLLLLVYTVGGAGAHLAALTWPALGPVDDLLNGGNPPVIVWELLDHLSNPNARLDDLLFPAVRHFALVHGALALAGFTVAVRRLRAAAQRADGGLKRGRVVERPAVGDRPVFWKARYCEAGDAQRRRERVVGRVFFVSSLVALAGVAAWLGITDPAALGPILNAWMRYVGLVAVMLLGMHLALSVHGSVVREHEQGTLGLVLLTPVGVRAVLTEKMLGHLLGLRWPAAWLALTGLVAVVGGGLSWWALPLLVVAWLVFFGFAAALGLACGVTALTRPGEVRVFLGVWFCSVIGAVALAAPSGSPLLTSSLLALVPPVNLGVLTFTAPDPVQIVPCGFGLLMYAAAAWFLWREAVGRLARDLDVPTATGSDRRPFIVVPLRRAARSPSGRG